MINCGWLHTTPDQFRLPELKNITELCINYLLNIGPIGPQEVLITCLEYLVGSSLIISGTIC
jgi:hypothetical protein